MMPSGTFFELPAGGGAPIPLRLEGEVTGDGDVQALVLGDVGEPADVLVPLPPPITSGTTMDSRTQYTLTWLAPVNTGRPAITGYKVFRSQNGEDYAQVGSTLASTSRTLVDTPLPTSSPEIIFRYYVKAVNGDGDGNASDVIAVQFEGVVTQRPAAPTGLFVDLISTTSVRLNWTINSETVDKQGVWQNDILLKDGLDASTTSYLWTQLPAGTTQGQVDIRRYNSEGWSNPSNKVSFKTLTSSGIIQRPVQGQAVPVGELPYRTQIPAIRVYDFSQTVARANTYSPQIISVTDPGTDTQSSKTGLEWSASRLEANLISFYETGTGFADRQDIEYHFANGNEADKDGAGYTSGTLPTNYINTYALYREVIHQTQGGVRRFPNASLWVNMTTSNLDTEATGPRFKPIARYLDGFSSSMYPAGRTIKLVGGVEDLLEYNVDAYPTGSYWDGRSRNNYAFYIDHVFVALDDWRKTGSAAGTSLVGQLDRFATWEVGIPIHHSLRGDNLTNYVRSGTLANGGTDLTQRPRYLIGGARTSGTSLTNYNFKGFLQYIYEKCVEYNVSMSEQLYWNQQSNLEIPNIFRADEGKTDPDTSDAWYMWSPGFRLPNI